MIDPKLLREQLDMVIEKLSRRGFLFDKAYFLALEMQRRDLQTKVQELQAQRNTLAKKIGAAKRNREDAEELLQEANRINHELADLEQALDETLKALENFLLNLPNIPHESVPSGQNEEDNIEIRCFGKPRDFDFPIQDHVDIGESLGLLDLGRAAKISGARFSVLKQDLSRLNRALIAFMLDTHTRVHGYEEVSVPYLIAPHALLGTGQLPKFAEDLFYVAADNLYLIPTAEVPVTNLFRDEILSINDLPLKLCAFTPCFRREAGAYGKDVRGLIRQHQFDKVELVNFTSPEDSYGALELLVHDAEAILQKLELPYRIVSLCAGDLGFASAKTFDIEVWLPSQQRYREISSCSNFEAFQARRMKTRLRTKEGKMEFIHTLNGSGLAVGRTLVAILENYQNMDGSVTIPEVLRPYLDGQETIKKF